MEFLGKKNKQPYASNNDHLESKEPIYIYLLNRLKQILSWESGVLMFSPNM